MSFLSPALTLLEKIITSRTEAPSGVPRINYLEPPGDPGIFGPASVTWRVLSNPASVFIGGVTPALFQLSGPHLPPRGPGRTHFLPHPPPPPPSTPPRALSVPYP